MSPDPRIASITCSILELHHAWSWNAAHWLAQIALVFAGVLLLWHIRTTDGNIRSVTWVPCRHTSQFYTFIHHFVYLSYLCTVALTCQGQVCWYKGCSQGREDRRMTARLQWYSPPLPTSPPHQRPQVSCPIWDHLSLDEMNMLSACVKFRKEFRDRYSKHYLPCARWEATIDWKTPIIVEGCVKLNGKKEEKKDCLHELKPSSTAYCDDHKAAKH